MTTKFMPLFFICGILLVSGCNSESSSPPNNNNKTSELNHIYTYQIHTAEAPLRDPASCVNYTRNCTVEELPFIAMNYPTPQIADIMTRVVVSHDWMAQRFGTLLAVLPNEILTLLGSVTAIVIADNIRPSFYWTGSGAIYLDPASLWLTNEEKSTIDQTPDYRSGFSNDLSYDFFHRFVKDGQAAYQYYSLTGNEERTLDDIIIPMASLLFHELAHANDFMSKTLMPSLIIDNPLWSEINRFSSVQLNETLKAGYPISDSTLKTHAAILYLGQQATEDQKLESAEYLGLLMQQEGANHLYAYSHKAEDVAMLFQATMLNYYYDIEMDSAFVIKPETKNPNCADYIIAWGQRNRIADATNKPRAQFVSQEILSNIDFTDFFNQLSDVQYFPALSTWCNNPFSETITVNRNTKIAKPALLMDIRKDHHHGAITVFQ